MERFKKYTLPLLLLGLLAALVAGFRSFFVAYIIEPIALMCWAVLRIIGSVDQNVYWMILIVACSILLIRLVPNDKGATPNSAYHYTYRSRSRVEFWKTLIKDAPLGSEEVENLRDNLEKLLISALPQAKGSDLENLAALAAAKKAPLSPQAYHFLFPPRGSGRMFSLFHGSNLMFFIPRRLRKWAAKFIQYDTTSIDEILVWLETEMEITHGN